MKIHNRNHWLLLAAICAAGSAYAGPKPGGANASAALLRLRSHYGAVKTCALEYNLTWSFGSTKRSFGSHRFFFSRPDFIQESFQDGPMERSSLHQRERVPMDAIIDPGNSPQIVPPQLLLGFRLADYFDKMESGGREVVRGVGTDVITLSKVLPSSGSKRGTWGDSTHLLLLLWIDDSGRLRRYESTIRVGGTVRASSRRGELMLEEDNRGLPKGLFAKTKR